jgi:hypothetical protein
MSLLATFEDSPFFATANDVHVTDGVDLLWTNVRALDFATLRMREAFQNQSEHRVEFIRTNPLDWWYGGFRFVTGITTLTLITYTAALGTGVTPKLRVILNGVARGDYTLTAGEQTHTLTLTGLGLTSGNAVEVLLQIVDTALVLAQGGDPDLPGEPDNPSDPQWGRYDLVDAYVSPLSATWTPAYPGLPSLTNSPTAAALNQLSNTADWLAGRIGVVPWPVFQRLFNVPTDFYEPKVSHLWSGGVVRGAGTRLVVEFAYQIVRTPAERFRLLINGSEVATTAVLTAGQHNWAAKWDVDISAYSATSRLRLEIQSVVTIGLEADFGGRPSRLTVEAVRVERGSPGHLTMPTRTAPDESTNWSTGRSRLGTLASHLSAIKARIDNSPDLFDRARLYRGGYAYNAGERLYLQFRHMPTQQRRMGRRLVVAGRNVKIGWGTMVIKPPTEQDGEVTLEFAYTETLIASNNVETREIWLDQLEGLRVSRTYTLMGGDVRFAAEYLR